MILFGYGDLLPTLDNKWPRRCSNAALALEQISDTCPERVKQATDKLIELLENENKIVRRNDSKAVGRIGASEAILELKNALKRKRWTKLSQL